VQPVGSQRDDNGDQRNSLGDCSLDRAPSRQGRKPTDEGARLLRPRIPFPLAGGVNATAYLDKARLWQRCSLCAGEKPASDQQCQSRISLRVQVELYDSSAEREYQL
ncbi:unnamed protein product, partial [Prorocentrum cordatum]